MYLLLSFLSVLVDVTAGLVGGVGVATVDENRNDSIPRLAGCGGVVKIRRDMRKADERRADDDAIVSVHLVWIRSVQQYVL